MLLKVSWKLNIELSIAFPFAILMPQIYIQRNKLRYLESRDLEYFHGIGNKQ